MTLFIIHEIVRERLSAEYQVSSRYVFGKEEPHNSARGDADLNKRGEGGAVDQWRCLLSINEHVGNSIRAIILLLETFTDV